MRRLLLLRHAEAVPARAELPDEQRPLTAHGRTEALDAAQCIADSGLRIEALLVSPALRTRETAIIVAAQLDVAAAMSVEPALYLGDAEALLSPLHRCQSEATVLMVGHNPGLSELARRFKGAHASLVLRTAGVCRVDLDSSSWSDVRAQVASAVVVLR
jgi:phosphohistidine phosphatase